jgi:hypothetical protein
VRRPVVVLLALVGLVLCVPGPAGAEDARFDRGSWEVGLRPGADSVPARTVGYFVADNLELVAHVADSVLTGADPGLDRDPYAGRTLRLDARLNLPSGGALVPYLGPGMEVFSHKVRLPGPAALDREGMDLHAVAGVHFLVGRVGALNLSLRTGVRRLDDHIAAATDSVRFADLALSWSRFF